jgi:hypothetical protein
MNAGLQRLVKRIQGQEPELERAYAKSLLDVCDALIRKAAERIVEHDVFGGGDDELDPDHTGRIVSLLEAKRTLGTWRAAPAG